MSNKLLSICAYLFGAIAVSSLALSFGVKDDLLSIAFIASSIISVSLIWMIDDDPESML